MFSMIITDYKSIPLSINLIEKFSQKCNSVIHYFIVDNSNQHAALNYLKENRISFESLVVLEKNIYFFSLSDNIMVHIVDADENGGYAKGNNIGAKISKVLFDDKYFIFANNDLEFPDNVNLEQIDLLVKKNPQIGIIGVDIRTPDGNRQNPRDNRGVLSQTILWEFNVLWFHCVFNKVLWNLSKDVSEREVGWVSGSFLIIASKAFFLVDGFDEHTFLYCEEMIISEKMRKKNICTYFFPQIKIIHFHKGAVTQQTRREGHRSKIYYYRTYKHVPAIICKFADFSYALCEEGYYLFHKIKTRFRKK